MLKRLRIIMGFLMVFGWLSPANGADEEMKFPRFICAGSAFRGRYASLPDGKIRTLPAAIGDIKDMNCQGIYWYLRRSNGAWSENYWQDKENAEKFVSIAKAHQLRNLYCTIGIWTMPQELGKRGSLWSRIPKEYLKKHNASLSINDPETLQLTLQAYRQIFDRYGKDVYGFVPGDEPCYNNRSIKKNEDDLREYRKYLKENFNRETLKKHGIQNIEQIELPNLETRTKNPFHWSTFYDFIDASMVNYITRQREFLRNVNPDIKMMACISTLAYLTNPLSCSFSKFAPVYDIIGTDLYTGCCGTVEGERSLIYEMLEYANPGGVWPVPGTYYGSYSRQLRRRIYLCAMHADGVCVWNYLYTRRAGAPYSDEETKEKYQAVKETYGNLSKIEDYLYKCRTISPVGIIFSEKTISNLYFGWKNRFPYFGNISGYWIMGLRNHIPMRALILDTITPEKLKDFKVLLLPNAECISDAQIDTLKNWVRNGGILISDGRTSLYTEHGVKRDNYGLKEVFGASYKKEGFLPDRILNWKRGKYIYQQNSPSFFNDVSSQLTKSILYTSPEIDVMKGAKVLSGYQDKSPAIIFNPYGEGGSILITAPYLGTKCFGEDVSHIGHLLQKIVNLALNTAKAKLPVYMIGCPEEIEINLREQNIGIQKNRILHLLVSYEANLSPLKKLPGVRARLQIPEGYKIVGLVDALTDKNVPYREGKNYIELRVPEFELYKCIVLKMVKGKKRIKRKLLPLSPTMAIRKKQEKKIPQELMTTASLNTDKKIKVAILNVRDKAGAPDLYRALEQIKGIQPEYIKDITSSSLADKNVLIIPPIPKGSYAIVARARKTIQNWIKSGHGLLACHCAIGYRYAGKSLFPDISTGGLGHPTVPHFIPVAKSPVTEGLKIGTVYPVYGYIDHIQIKPGKDGYVVAKDYILGNGNPVVVIGPAGKGRYVACGFFLGKSSVPNSAGEKGLPISGTELKLLTNSIKWLAYPSVTGGL